MKSTHSFLEYIDWQALRELAEKAGISESAMHSYELGDRKPKPEMIARIATALKVWPKYLSAPEFGPRLEFSYALLENDDIQGCIITEINDQPAIVAKSMGTDHSFYNLLSEWNKMSRRSTIRRSRPRSTRIGSAPTRVPAGSAHPTARAPGREVGSYERTGKKRGRPHQA